MRRLLALAAALALGTVFAHADLVGSDPEAGAVLHEAPATVTLTFSESVQVPFSIFKVYRLDAEVDLSGDNAAQRLNGLAAQLVTEVRELRDDSEAEARADISLESEGATADQLTLVLQEELPAGHYVVMWSALSVDTHTTRSFFVFSVE